jgi:hypothetical protein
MRLIHNSNSHFRREKLNRVSCAAGRPILGIKLSWWDIELFCFRPHKVPPWRFPSSKVVYNSFKSRLFSSSPAVSTKNFGSVAQMKKAKKPGAGGQLHKDFHSTPDLKCLPTSKRYQTLVAGPWKYFLEADP